MSYTEDCQSLIVAIKAKVHLLEWQDDWIALDKACGEIDILLYKLRQLILTPAVKAKPSVDWLAELEKEISNEDHLS